MRNANPFARSYANTPFLSNPPYAMNLSFDSMTGPERGARFPSNVARTPFFASLLLRNEQNLTRFVGELLGELFNRPIAHNSRVAIVDARGKLAL